MRAHCTLAALLLFCSAFASAQTPGALDGRRVFVSPGHGYYWHSSLGWTTQRPIIDGLIEDIHTNQIVMDYLLDYLEGAGAQTISCRARSRTTSAVIVDNDNGAPGYTESGTWFLSGSSGWSGGGYRYAVTSPAGGNVATFTATMPSDDRYPVFLSWRAGTNRSPDVEIEIDHAGGTSVRVVNQQQDDRTWVYVGTYAFRAGVPAVVRVTSRAQTPGVVIADAVRIGDGMGVIDRGGGVSGHPRWLEAARYHTQYCGAPSSVWNSISGGQDNDDDVSSRPRYSEWRGNGDLYLSLHTNAGGGSGTSTYIHNTQPTPGSASFQAILQQRLVADIRAGWDSNWIDRGVHSANFGELRHLSTMPGCLVELAFHDDLGGDIEAIHHPRFRRVAARAMYRAIQSYLAPGTPWVLEPPEALAMTNDGQGNLVLQWNAIPGASSYLVRLSEDGFGYDDGVIVNGTSLTISGLGHGERRFAQIAVVNGGGRGPFSQEIGARLAPGGLAPLLLVEGFDRLDRNVKSWENQKDGLSRNGAAIDAVTDAGYPFDSATNEAVSAAMIFLWQYPCVGWILGEESTVDETFSTTEQGFIVTHLNYGGSFFFTGAEVGWDLDNLGSSFDRLFYEQYLGQDYVQDDANTYATLAQSTGPLAPLPAMTFGNGSNGAYDVDWPDVVQPSTLGGGQIVLRYSNGLGAGVLHGNGRVLGLGFPMEALVDASHRAQLMARILKLLCPLPVSAPAPVANQVLNVDLNFPGQANAAYLAAASLAPSPGIALGDGRFVPLEPDGVFLFSIDPVQTLFTGMSGTLDAQGQGQFQVFIPAGLSGLEFVVSAVTLDAVGVTEVAPWYRITLP